MVTIDVPHVFRVFNGPQGLLDLLDRRQPGHGLRYNTVQMWQQRRSIPTKFLGAVFYCIELEGYKCAEFLVDYDEMRPVPHNNTPTNARVRR
jgi:hypothetical protein